MHLKCSDELNSDDLEISFSEDKHGEILIKTFKFDFNDSKSADTIHSLELPITETTKERYNLIKQFSNVNGFVLHVHKPISKLYICDINIRNDGYTNTIEDVEAEYENGINHIISRLPYSISSKEEIPTQLQYLTHMAAAGYLITKRLQNEFKKSDSGHISSRNHGRWLLQQVDSAINSYLEDMRNASNEYTINYTWIDPNDARRDIY